MLNITANEIQIEHVTTAECLPISVQKQIDFAYKPYPLKNIQESGTKELWTRGPKPTLERRPHSGTCQNFV